MPRTLQEEITHLEDVSVQVRVKVLESLFKAQSGHLGPSLSATELLVALYFREMHNVTEKDPLKRDVFILSKGHAAPALYAVLAERGLIDAQHLSTLREMGSPLQGHPERHRLGHVDATTGSLGQGLSMAQGYALGFRLSKSSNRVFCMIGDGESQEGQIWEAALSIPNFHLDSVVCIVDYNKFQNERAVIETMPIEPVADKWRAFGWDVIDIDGHDYAEILEAFERARISNGRPKLIIAHTVKSMGVSFMEGNPAWHSKSVDQETYTKAFDELRGEDVNGNA